MGIIADKIGSIDNKGLMEYSFYNEKYYLDGLIYSYGKKEGIETISWLAEEYHKTGVIPFSKIMGAFSLFIKTEDAIIAFSDNSKLHSVYYSDSIFGNRFLEVSENIRKFGSLHFDEESICEYYTLGRIFFEKTFFKEVHVLSSEECIIVKKGTIKIKKKDIGDIEGESTLTSIGSFFEQMAYSFSDKKICQALTGGYDSRMVFACLSKYAPDHVAISGNVDTDSDIVFARKVAEASGQDLQVVKIEKPEFSEDLIGQIIFRGDGLEPLDIDTSIRLFQFKNVLSENYNIHLTGDGGVLHKDWEWMQDFPFYHKKHSDARRFYRQRLYFIPVHKHIGKSLQKLFDEQEDRFVNRLDAMAKEINTKSYDVWYYNVSGNRQVYYSNNPLKGIISYAPLEELDVVRYSYHLPRRKRFFYYSIRKETTASNPEIAKIKTNYGTTASNEFPYMLRDVAFQTIDYGKKACRLFIRKIFGKNMLHGHVMDWSMEDDLRKSEYMHKAFCYAVDSNLIKEDISIFNFSYSEMQRISHIYWLYMRFLKNK